MQSLSSALSAALVVLASGACSAPASSPQEPLTPAVEEAQAVGCPMAGAPHPPLADATGRVIRYGPIVTPDMFPAHEGLNISVPSPIEVPEWLPGRLGRYYLYFSNHRSPRQIRLAYADRIAGPWRVADRDAVTIDHSAPAARYTLAPDAIVDHERREIRLYLTLHFRPRDPLGRRGGTYVATSQDGQTFSLKSQSLGAAYGRVLHHDGAYYLFLGAAGQTVVRSADGFSKPAKGPRVLPRPSGPGSPFSRHVGLQRDGDTLRVFFTRKRDAPERVLMGTINLRDRWLNWRVADVEEVLRPAMPYEGVNIPIRPSRPGPAARQGEHALRDPAVLTAEGRTWLFYTIAGECGIALAEIRL